MRTPSKATLKKYGIDEYLWTLMYTAQDGKCAICGKPFEDTEKDRISFVDHEHVKNYKNLKPERKRQYLRGLLCFQCNRLILQKSATLDKLRAAVKYLEKYEKSKATLS